jgi:hypothetical protein
LLRLLVDLGNEHLLLGVAGFTSHRRSNFSLLFGGDIESFMNYGGSYCLLLFFENPLGTFTDLGFEVGRNFCVFLIKVVLKLLVSVLFKSDLVSHELILSSGFNI